MLGKRNAYISTPVSKKKFSCCKRLITYGISVLMQYFSTASPASRICRRVGPNGNFPRNVHFTMFTCCSNHQRKEGQHGNVFIYHTRRGMTNINSTHGFSLLVSIYYCKMSLNSYFTNLHTKYFLKYVHY